MHDKLSDHYTSSKNYTDELGHTRSFDFIDHDVKTKIRVPVVKTKEEIAEEKAQYREWLIDKIISIEAIYCPDIFIQYTHRGDVQKIDWNLKMLQDAGVPTDKLLDIYTLSSNKMNLIQ
jgi:hypothetical protein